MVSVPSLVFARRHYRHVVVLVDALHNGVAPLLGVVKSSVKSHVSASYPLYFAACKMVDNHVVELFVRRPNTPQIHCTPTVASTPEIAAKSIETMEQARSLRASASARNCFASRSTGWG